MSSITVRPWGHGDEVACRMPGHDTDAGSRHMPTLGMSRRSPGHRSAADRSRRGRQGQRMGERDRMPACYRMRRRRRALAPAAVRGRQSARTGPSPTRMHDGSPVDRQPVGAAQPGETFDACPEGAGWGLTRTRPPAGRRGAGGRAACGRCRAVARPPGAPAGASRPALPGGSGSDRPARPPAAAGPPPHGARGRRTVLPPRPPWRARARPCRP